MKRFDRQVATDSLDVLAENDPELSASIRKMMFTFEDLMLIDSAAMKEVVAKIDKKLLVVALKGTSEQLKDHFTRRMSTRAKEMLLEDLDALGPVKIKDVEAAQQQVVAVIRQLEQQGVVSLRGSVGEQYVV